MGRKRLRPPANESTKEKEARLQQFINRATKDDLADDLADGWVFTFRGPDEAQEAARERVKKGEMT